MRLGRSLRSFLWIASTPLALSVLLSEPAVRADTGAEHGEVTEHAEHGGGEHHFLTNPIENLTRFDYRGKDAHGEPMDAGDHPMPPPFSMNILNFAVFAFLIGRMAGPSIKRVVRERHDEIARALADSARMREEAKARLEEYTKKLASLDSEIDALVKGIRSEAEAAKTRIIAEAEARAERMQRDAAQQIEAEMQRVRTALEREAVEAAVRIAETLLREKTGDADQRALADRFVKGLGDATGRKRPRA